MQSVSDMWKKHQKTYGLQKARMHSFAVLRPRRLQSFPAPPRPIPSPPEAENNGKWTELNNALRISVTKPEAPTLLNAHFDVVFEADSSLYSCFAFFAVNLVHMSIQAPELKLWRYLKR